MSQPTSLVRFMHERTDSRGKPIYWGRAGIDGAPFRGTPPLLKEEEMEARLVRTGDPQNGIFDLSDDRQNATYLTILDKVVNGRAQLLSPRHFIDGGTKVYIEWVEWFMEDGAPGAATTPGLPST